MINDIPNPSLGTNSKNKIRTGMIGGIGLIHNKPKMQDRSRIYKEQN